MFSSETSDDRTSFIIARISSREKKEKCCLHIHETSTEIFVLMLFVYTQFSVPHESEKRKIINKLAIESMLKIELK